MEILELKIKHFGKFQDHTMKFYPGINVICGGNESGKSTIHAFIRAMLFGMSKGRGRRGEELEKRRPWDNPAYYCGMMRVQYRDEIYRIERDFSGSGQADRMINETIGEEIGDLDAKIREMLGGMDEEAFINTLFISQSGSRTEQSLAKQLQEYLVNEQETGDASVNVNQALEILKQKKKKLEAEKKEKRLEMEEQIREKLQEKEYLQREIQKLQETQKPQREERVRNLNGYDSYNDMVESENLTEGWNNRLREDLEYQLNDEEAIQRQDNRNGNDILAGSELILKIVLFAAGLFFTVLGIFLREDFFGWVLMLFGMSMLLILTVWLLAGMLRRDAKRENLHAMYRNSRNSAKEDPLRTSDRELRHMRRLQQISEEQKEKEDRVLREKQEAEKQGWLREEAGRQLREKKRSMILIEEELAEFDKKRASLAWYDREVEAIELAMLRISELSAKIYRERGGSFAMEVSRILNKLTRGRYEKIALDEQMQVRLNTPDKLLSLQQVSEGTLQQVYFALRMASARLLTHGEMLPIILDEPFAMYDDSRMMQAMQWLYESDRQVILFSSQRREKITLDHLTHENNNSK